MSELGIAVAPYAEVARQADVYSALARTGRPAILKTRRLGYDGKGQATVRAGDDPVSAWRAIGEAPALLEAFVGFEREVSVILARGRDGTDPRLRRGGERPRQWHPCDHHRPRRDPRSDRRGSRGDRRQDRRCPRPCRRAGRRDVRRRRLRPPAPARQRDRPARPQFRALDLGRVPHIPVRAAHPRHLRLAARRPGPPFRRNHDQPHRRRGLCLAGARRRARRPAPSLRQESEIRPGRKMGHVNRIFPRPAD